MVFLLSIIMSPFFQNIVGSGARNLENPSNICALLNLINLTYDEPFRFHFVSYGMPINENLLWTIFFYAALSIMLFCLLVIIKEHSHKQKLISTSVCILCAFVCIFSYCGVLKTSPIVYNFFESNEQGILQTSEKVDNQNIVNENKNWNVESYHMDVDLKSNFHNKCTIKLETQLLDDNQIIKLKLDSCFHINEILVNGIKTSYKRDNDWLSIQTKDKLITLEIDYQGKINYADGLLQKTVFCEDFASYLPEIFAWYPRLQNNQENILFTLNVNSSNPVVSNIKRESNSNNKTLFSGKTKDVFLFSGFIESVSYQDKIFIVPQASPFRDEKDFHKLQNILDLVEQPNNVLNSPFSFNVTEEMFVNKQFQTYVFIPYSYDSIGGLPYAIDDICIINEYILSLDFSK